MIEIETRQLPGYKPRQVGELKAIARAANNGILRPEEIGWTHEGKLAIWGPADILLTVDDIRVSGTEDAVHAEYEGIIYLLGPTGIPDIDVQYTEDRSKRRQKIHHDEYEPEPWSGESNPIPDTWGPWEPVEK